MVMKFIDRQFSPIHVSFTELLHGHKKPEDSLETRAEQAVLRAYVENQAILEPVLFYRASKYKQTKRLRLFVNSHFAFLCD